MAAAGSNPDTPDRPLCCSLCQSKVSNIFPYCLHCIKPGTPRFVFPRFHHEPCTDETHPPFPYRHHLGETEPWQCPPQRRKVPAKALMNFPFLAPDPKPTVILFRGGENEDAAMAETSRAKERCGPRNSRAYDGLRPPPAPKQQLLRFSLPLDNEKARPALSRLG